jgi:photosystem II stability/assembly factor-like uncharacterized protein
MALANPGLLWRKTNAPISSSRTDDIWFATSDVGWAVNSNGQIVKTEDGGNSWTVQLQDTSVYLRCIGFAGTQFGWAGTVSGPRRLFATRDGGATWTTVANLPDKPTKVCGISVVDEQVIYASGTNDPSDDPAVLRTRDGGATWDLIDMRAHASLLVDIHFQDRNRGWVVGGRDVIACPGRRATRDVVRPVVLFTEDGGTTWTDLIPANAKRRFPLGEWGWKIFFLNDRIAFISLENFVDGAILKSVDGGKSWDRLRINDRQRNSNLEGIGFISEDTGWVGGWGDIDFIGGFTSQTQDGANNWDNANEVGFRLNRFRFFGKPVTVGYASGDTIYKYSTGPTIIAPELMAAAPSLIRTPHSAVVSPDGEDMVIDVPQNARSLSASVWDRFGNRVELLSETRPSPGPRTIRWTPEGPLAAHLLGSTGVFRVAVDDFVESRLVALSRIER